MRVCDSLLSVCVCVCVCNKIVITWGVSLYERMWACGSVCVWEKSVSISTCEEIARARNAQQHHSRHTLCMR